MHITNSLSRIVYTTVSDTNPFSNIDVIYADTWCAKLVDNDIYKSDLLSVSAGQAKNIKMPGTVTDTTSNSISEEKKKEKGKDTVTNEDGTTQEFSYTSPVLSFFGVYLFGTDNIILACKKFVNPQTSFELFVCLQIGVLVV